VVIDASGYGAAVSKKAGLHEGFRRFGVGAEWELLSSEYDQTEAVVLVGSEFAPSGYAWAFPWGQDRVRVGVGILHRDSRQDPLEILENILSSGIGALSLGSFERVEYHFGLIPSDGIAKSIVGNGVMAVGDAAGQGTQMAGEGIRLSMAAGERAASVAANAIAMGRTDKANLFSYETSFRKQHGWSLAIGQFLNRRMAKWDDQKWNLRVRQFQGLPHDLVPRLLQSEFTPADLVRSVAKHPSLWPTLVSTAVYGMRERLAES